MPYLIQKAADGSFVNQWDLRDETVKVGRGDQASPKITDREMSRIHFTIHKEGDGFVITDHGSSNGTWVNGKRISGPVALNANDKIRAGVTWFVYVDGLATVIGQLEQSNISMEKLIKQMKNIPNDSKPHGTD